MSNKKGLETLPNILLVILSFAILIFFVSFAYSEVISESQDRQICYDSVLLKAGTKFGGTESKFDLQCKTFDNIIKATDEERIKELLADELYWCYRQYGSGQVDFIREWGGNSRCYLCNEISFSKATKKENDKIRGLFEFMNNEESPTRGKTYAEYILNQAEADFGDEVNDFVIDTSKTYGIAYRVDKINPLERYVGKPAFRVVQGWGVFAAIVLIVAAPPAAAALGVIAVSSTIWSGGFYPGFVIADYDTLKNQCEDNELLVFEKVEKELS